MTGEAKDVALIAVIAIAPLAIVMIIALIRGYHIDVHFFRGSDKSKHRDDDQG
jgi:hypothetical protein